MGDVAREIARLLLEKEAVILRPSQPFQFASGILSPIYCDNRILLSDVPARRTVASGLAEFTREFSPDVVAGTATAGIAWGAYVAEILSKPFAYVRSEAKSHGKQKQVEGRIPSGSRVVLIEDLISTGKSVLAAGEGIEREGPTVAGVVGIFTYGMKEAEEEFRSRGRALRTLSNFSVLMDVAIELKRINESSRASLLSWHLDPRSWVPFSS